jgi:hypothetical protein
MARQANFLSVVIPAESGNPGSQDSLVASDYRFRGNDKWGRGLRKLQASVD